MKCAICKEEIIDIAYCELNCSIVIQDKENKQPLIFTSPEQRGFYSTKIYLHDNCFISLIGTKTNLKLEGGLCLIPVSQ